MVSLLNLLIGLIVLVLFVPIGFLFVECMAALWPDKSSLNVAKNSRPSIAVLIPAHNEASCIHQSLFSIIPQLTSEDRLIVVADNCTDETALIGRQIGATVIERQDREKRGKGYALDYGLKSLENNPPNVVVLVDADCQCEPGSIEEIAQKSHNLQKPVQAIYLMEKPAYFTPKDAISALAFMVKNLVRPKGLYQLGMPCLLTGTGMAFPWEIIHNAPLASGNIVEDMQLGLDLAIDGYSPLLSPQARVTGILPKQATAATSQRTRWEHGHLQTLLNEVPKLIENSIKQKRLDLFILALELLVPPLSFLVMLWMATAALGIIGTLVGTSMINVIIIAIEGLLIVISIMAGWAKFGRDDIPGSTLVAIPLYLLWKIPMYFSFLRKRQTEWIKTDRDN